MMAVREDLTAEMKASMRAGDAPRTSTIRMIMAKLKDTDIAARPGDPISDDEITKMLRGMVKQRREAAELYTKGQRPELAAKEMAEITVIEGFLPQQMDEAALAAAVDAAVAQTGATSVKQTGQVMAVLKAAHGAGLDMGRAGALVKARLG